MLNVVKTKSIGQDRTMLTIQMLAAIQSVVRLPMRGRRGFIMAVYLNTRHKRHHVIPLLYSTISPIILKYSLSYMYSFRNSRLRYRHHHHRPHGTTCDHSIHPILSRPSAAAVPVYLSTYPLCHNATIREEVGISSQYL